MDSDDRNDDKSPALEGLIDRRSRGLVRICDLARSGARPEIIRAAEYYNGLTGHHRMPRRRRLSLYDMHWVVGHAFLVDLLPDEDDFSFRYFGDKMTKIYGADFTGLRLSTVGNPNLRNLLRATYNAVAATRMPFYLSGKYCWPTHEIGVERLLLPLADEQDHLASILGVIYTDVAEDLLAEISGKGPALFVPNKPKAFGAPHSGGSRGSPQQS